jgi:hypothetical protein|tara:strand:- start:352 stop:552 length:201 start_codon:yes stop_codon:yes gene_type:complete
LGIGASFGLFCSVLEVVEKVHIFDVGLALAPRRVVREPSFIAAQRKRWPYELRLILEAIGTRLKLF